MKMRNLLLVATLLFAFTSCDKDDDDNNIVDDEVTYTETEIDVSGDDDLYKWKYFNFESNELVDITDSVSQTSLAWDLGIHFESFRTNGGTSGIGQGAIVDLGEVEFSSVTLSSLDSVIYIEDDSISVLSGFGAYGPIFENVPGCIALEDMFASPTGPTDQSYTPNNHVYIIKTADGKNVKLIGTTFFNELAEYGHVNLKYEFLD